jgi:hypothetical protein
LHDNCPTTFVEDWKIFEMGAKLKRFGSLHLFPIIVQKPFKSHCIGKFLKRNQGSFYSIVKRLWVGVMGIRKPVLEDSCLTEPLFL